MSNQRVQRKSLGRTHRYIENDSEKQAATTEDTMDGTVQNSLSVDQLSGRPELTSNEGGCVDEGVTVRIPEENTRTIGKTKSEPHMCSDASSGDGIGSASVVVVEEVRKPIFAEPRYNSECPPGKLWETIAYQSTRMEEPLVSVFEDDIEDSTELTKGDLHPNMVTLWNHYNSINPIHLGLAGWAETRQNEMAVSWLDAHGDVSASMTYTELLKKSETVAVYMQEYYELRPGDRVILCFPPGVGFIVAFYACLFSGVIAVPVYPPTPANQNHDVDRFLDIRKNAEVKVILTEKMYSRIAQLMRRLWVGGDSGTGAYLSLGPAVWVCIEDALKYKCSTRFVPVRVAPWTPAFLQFTSGSTSTPKGVVVTHGSLLHNCHVCGISFGFPSSIDDKDTHITIAGIDFTLMRDVLEARHAISRRVNGHPVRVFSWLPVYHDMGLIGGMVAPLFGGMQLIQMSPIDFIRRPELWLAGMSKYKCSACAAPNFAFELAVRRTSDEVLTNLDLSHLCGIICGAEPIKLCTMQKFFEKFSSVGLSEEVIIPAYGLAENTLIVSSRKTHHDKPKVLVFDSKTFRVEGLACPASISKNRGLIELNRDNVEELNKVETQGDQYMTLIGCGPRAPQVDVRIVDPKTMKEVPERVCGEIWFTGASKARGYYKHPEKSQNDFMASCTLLDGTETDGRYIRSGDSGFIYDGELFVAGRIKDMLIIRGKNFYPQDIESVLDSIPELRAGCTVCFASEDEGGEELCLAVELRDSVLNSSYLSRASTMGSWLPQCLQQKCTDHSVYKEDSEFFEYISGVIVASILKRVNLKVSRLYILKSRTIAKTTSGKVRRHASKTALLGVNHPKGLLYSRFYEGTGEERPSIDDIKYIEEWPGCVDEALEMLAEELFSIVRLCVPGDMLPKVSSTDAQKSVMKEGVSEFLNRSLGELGMDSPTTVEFGERLKRRIWKEFCIFQLDLPIICPTLCHLVLYILEQLTGMKVDVSEDVTAKLQDLLCKELTHNREDNTGSLTPEEDIRTLCDRVQVSPSACLPMLRAEDWKNVMLTGATGSLGAWQLKFILEYFPKMHVYVLVRAANADAACKKLISNSVLAKRLNLSRITIVLGDVSKPGLGIEPTLYRTLTKTIHCFIHTAADINLFRSYRRLRPTNVLSTLRVVEFCSTYRMKAIHFASTLGIYPQYFAQFRDEYSNMEIDAARPTNAQINGMFPPHTMGYPWSKLASEQILERANSLGLPCAIYRYPLTCMSYVDGSVQKGNLTIPLMLTALQEGMIPKSFTMISTTPSDIVALRSVIIALSGVAVEYFARPWWGGASVQSPRSLSPVGSPTPSPRRSECAVINLTDTRVITASKLIEWLDEFGLSMKMVESAEELIDAAIARGEDSSFKHVLPMIRSPIFKYLMGTSPTSGHDIPVSTATANLYLDIAESVMKGKAQDVERSWPDLRELFKRSLMYMIRNGYITDIKGDVLDKDSKLSPFKRKVKANEAMSLTKKMLRNVIARAPCANISVKGRVLMSVFAKYSYAIAHELGPVTFAPDTYESVAPTVVVLVGLNKQAMNRLQSLLVLSCANDIMKAPTIQTCIPRGKDDSLGVELLQVFNAVGLLAAYHTSGVALARGVESYADIVELPVDDTLLLEMLPDEAPAATTLVTYGAAYDCKPWTTRYQYHKQYLSQRDIYREGQIVVLNSDLHLIHLKELRDTYGNVKIIHVVDDTPSSYGPNNHDIRKGSAYAASMITISPDFSRERYQRGWTVLEENVRKSCISLPKDVIEVSVSTVERYPLNAVNHVYNCLREGGDTQLCEIDPTGPMKLLKISTRPGIIQTTVNMVIDVYMRWSIARCICNYFILRTNNVGWESYSWLIQVLWSLVTMLNFGII